MKENHSLRPSFKRNDYKFLLLAGILWTTVTNFVEFCEARRDPRKAGAFYRSRERWIYEQGTIWDIYQWKNCERDHHGPHSVLEIHNQTVWKQIRSIYHSVVDEDVYSLPQPSVLEKLSPEEDWGYQVPIQVKMVPNIGRGIFAAQNIPEGNLVWESTYTAQFTTGHAYRQFLKELPSQLTCDIILWAYTRYNEEEEPLVCVDLDPGSFVNGCDFEEDCNLELSEEADEYSGCNLAFYASRDIVQGEELRLDYGFSAMNEGWVSLGLISPDMPDIEDDFDDDSYDEHEDERDL